LICSLLLLNHIIPFLFLSIGQVFECKNIAACNKIQYTVGVNLNLIYFAELVECLCAVILKRRHNVVLRVDRQSILNLSNLFLSVSLQFNHSLNLTLPLILSLLHLLPCVFEFQSLFNLIFFESNYITRSSFESKIPLNVYYSLATQLSFHRKSPEKKDGGFFVGRQFIEAFCEFNCDEVDQGESEKKGNAYQDSSIEGLGDNIPIANGDK
jgi:hypothetical protein